MKRSTILLVSAAMTLAACGSEEATSDDLEAASNEVAEAIGSGDSEAVGESVDDLVDELTETQAEQGGGSASLTVGDQTYEFDSVLCAFGEDEIGQEGAEFVLSAIADGTQFYVSIDSFGHSVSLDDIEDFENPSVSLASQGDDFIEIDGRSASGDAEFLDGTSEGFDTQPGSFEATCP